MHSEASHPCSKLHHRAAQCASRTCPLRSHNSLLLGRCWPLVRMAPFRLVTAGSCPRPHIGLLGPSIQNCLSRIVYLVCILAGQVQGRPALGQLESGGCTMCGGLSRPGPCQRHTPLQQHPGLPRLARARCPAGCAHAQHSSLYNPLHQFTDGLLSLRMLLCVMPVQEPLKLQGRPPLMSSSHRAHALL